MVRFLGGLGGPVIGSLITLLGAFGLERRQRHRDEVGAARALYSEVVTSAGSVGASGPILGTRVPTITHSRVVAWHPGWRHRRHAGSGSALEPLHGVCGATGTPRRWRRCAS